VIVVSRDRKWITDWPVAHRGLHDGAIPENSVGAFNAAVDAGYGIELDVHLSRDGRIVVFHDDNAKRLTGRDLKITSASFAELSALRLADTEYRISAIEEVLELVAGRVPLLIEVKTGSRVDRLGPLLGRLLADYSGPVAVQSFDPRVVVWLRKHLPEVPRGQISGALREVPGTRRALLRTMALNAVSRPDFLAFEIGAMPDRFVAFWRRTLKVPLLLWTVRTEEELAAAHRYGANVIFEDIRPSA
jgi:glycerophosphoryl diester phosphodiesterase